MKKTLILCGTYAAVVYVGTVILGGLIRPGYSHIADAISELVADDAPNRTLLSPLFLIYNLLLSAFVLGSFLKSIDQAYRRRSGYIGSFVLMLIGLAGISMEIVFPQDPGGIPTTFAGTMHMVMAGVASIGTMVAVLALGFWFKNFTEWSSLVSYSMVTVVVIFMSGALSAAAMANHHPLFGLIERITIVTFILWLFIISHKMVQLESDPSHPVSLETIGSASKGK